MEENLRDFVQPGQYNLPIPGGHKTGWLEPGPGEDKNLNEVVYAGSYFYFHMT